MPSDAPHLDDLTRTFRVTHPFHPLAGREFEIANIQHTWAEERVFYYDAQHDLQSLPIAWTSLAPTDPFVLFANGRAHFRLQDLMELARFLRTRPTRPARP